MKKVGLLLGIDRYTNARLKNAANDAQALTRKLTELGFECSCLIDVDRQTMDEQIHEFINIMIGADVALFFFAGHGIQCKGENYLTAIDTNFADESSCKYTSTPLNYVIDTFEQSTASTKIIILDACRNNPFENRWRSSSIGGLAPVYAPKGTIIAYATSPGQIALDGNGENGVYTYALLSHIGTKRLAIEDMFKRVRNTVSSITNNKQITWEHTSLMGTFYFNSGFDDGEFSAAYSKTAIADSEYTFEDESTVRELVESLKSHNWYIQNPIFTRIKHFDFSNSEIDELFILGRNIYQAACGTATNAVYWIENLENQLKIFSANVAFHILNGILFEIYFDCNGKLRKSFKAEYYKQPLRLCFLDAYKNSCSFIRKYLEQYTQRIIYLPGTEEVACADIIIKNNPNSEYYIDRICIDGIDCMYSLNEDRLYRYIDNDEYTLTSITKLEFESKFYKTLVIPKNKIKIAYNIEVNNDEKLICPYIFILARFEL